MAHLGCCGAGGVAHAADPQPQSGSRTWRAGSDEHLGYYMLRASNCRRSFLAVFGTRLWREHLGALCRCCPNAIRTADSSCATEVLEHLTMRGGRTGDRALRAATVVELVWSIWKVCAATGVTAKLAMCREVRTRGVARGRAYAGQAPAPSGLSRETDVGCCRPANELADG